MRLAISGLMGIFLAATLVGCGGSSLPSAPGDAKPGPPPGSSDIMTKKAEPPNAKKR